MDRWCKHFRVGHADQFFTAYKMKNLAPIRLSSIMNLNEIANEIKNLGGSKALLQQEHRFENGVEVIYLRPATLKEKIKTALMSKTMRMEQALPAYTLILNIAKKQGIPVEEGYLRNIKKTLSSGGDLAAQMKQLRDFAPMDPTRRFSLGL